VVVAAGALATPHLLLASGLEERNPAGDVVGRYIMRHCNGIVHGIFAQRPDRSLPFHKQIGIHDYYFGDTEAGAPPGKLGSLQQLTSPPVGIVTRRVPRLVRGLVPQGVRHVMGLLAIAEDRPQHENRVRVDRAAHDAFGLPRLVIEHRYDERDHAARDTLMTHARQILARAGAHAFKEHEIETFSHALGTVRMGDDPETSPLDRDCRFRGIDNLWVVDASCLPLSGAVNPSLTIAANALRVGARLAAEMRASR
jgi:choline dehydrogenase-like flavoprotein